MLNRREIENQLIELSNFHELVGTYEEISASRMRKVRSWVLVSRDFLSGLMQIFGDIRSSYKAKLAILGKSKEAEKLLKMSLIKRNGKSVSVFISANTRLYGALLANAFALFSQHLEKVETDVVIVGKVGKGLFESKYPGRKFEHFEMSDTAIEAEGLHKLVSTLLAYDNIYVVYGQYQNTVNQKPVLIKISSDEFINQQKAGGATKFIFEPSLEKLITFFESEIFTSLFEQTIQESQLGKFASRMVTLDFALEKVEEELKKVKLDKRRIMHEAINKKQQDLLSGISLWNK